MKESFKLIKALGDENRLEIVKLLLKKCFCVRALAKELGISESAVSQHLKILREADLVVGEKRGYWVHYRVKRDKLKKLAEFLNQLVEEKNEVICIKQCLKSEEV